MIKIHALSRPRHANGDLSGTQNDFISSLLNQNIQRRPSHAHRGDRGLDHVSFLLRISGYKAKSTLCQLDGDITWLGIVKHRSIKLQSGARPKRQVGVIAKHQSCIHDLSMTELSRDGSSDDRSRQSWTAALASWMFSRTPRSLWNRRQRPVSNNSVRYSSRCSARAHQRAEISRLRAAST